MNPMQGQPVIFKRVIAADKGLINWAHVSNLRNYKCHA